MSVKSRLVLFLKSKNLSQGKFEDQVGLSKGFVSSIGKGINTVSLSKIKAAFPTLNTDWLQTGEGEMEDSEVLNVGEAIKRISATSDVLLAAVAEILALAKNEPSATTRANLEKMVNDKLGKSSEPVQEIAAE